MRRAVVAILLVAGALAGCSDPGGDEATPDVTAGEADEAALAGPQGNRTVAATVTDTLWLTSQARLDTAEVANLTILATLSGPVPQAFAWNATLNGTGNLTEARLVLWVDLQNSAVQGGVGGDPGCSAAMTVVLTLNGTATSQPGGCASLGSGLVAPGEHRLDFSTLLTAFPDGAAVRPGDGIAVQVQFGFAFPQGVGYVLGGADHDSTLRLPGLVEPLAFDAVAPPSPSPSPSPSA